MPTKTAPNPSQWMPEDIDVVQQYHYKTDVDKFRKNHIDRKDLLSINVKDHSTYIEVVKADHGTVIEKSVFSVAAYQEVLWLRGGDVDKFDKAIGAKFPCSTKGSRTPDEEKVPIDRVMLVCQRPNDTDVEYHDSNGFGHPGTMGLWDLHSSNALNLAQLVLKRGVVDTNFCPFVCILVHQQRNAE